MRHLKSIGAILLGLAVLVVCFISVIIFFVLPYALNSEALHNATIKYLNQNIRGEVFVESMRLSVFPSLKINLNNIRLEDESKRPVIELEKGEIGLSLKALWHKNLTGRLIFYNPTLYLRKNKSNKWTLLTIFKSTEHPATSSNNKSNDISLLADIEINQGSIHLDNIQVAVDAVITVNEGSVNFKRLGLDLASTPLTQLAKTIPALKAYQAVGDLTAHADLSGPAGKIKATISASIPKLNMRYRNRPVYVETLVLNATCLMLDCQGIVESGSGRIDPFDPYQIETFDKVHVPFTLKDKILNNQDVVIAGSGWDVRLDGHADLGVKNFMIKAPLDYQGFFSLDANDKLFRNLDVLKTSDEQIKLPLRIQGTLDDPRVDLDKGSLIQDTAKKALEQHQDTIKEELKKGLDKLFK